MQTITTKLIAVLLLLSLTDTGWASTLPNEQNREIEGTVNDQAGAPLEGVTVSVPKTTIGTKTGTDGRYTITVPGESTSLKFTLLGYDSLVVSIGTEATINATLTQTVSDLEEVVVVGYGTA